MSTSTLSNRAAVERNNPTADPDDLDNDDDALFEALENEDDSAYRAHRIEQLNAEFAKEANLRHAQRDPSSTTDNNTLYPTLANDQSLLDFTTQTHRCVIHFAHPDFARCGVMDEHLRELASRHYEVRFARVDVRNIPFVVEKLNIRVLPCVIGFKDGVAVERVVGFEGLGAGGKQDGADQISTLTLERRLLRKGILVRSKFTAGEGDDAGSDDEGSNSEGDSEPRRRRTIRGRNTRRNSNTGDDDDDDWD